jgi:hypothetical protein
VAKEGLYVADAALVTKDAEGNPKTLERQSHHGWGKGAVAGAVVGVLFPPSLIGGAIAGGLAGGGVARLTRSLGRGRVKKPGRGSRQKRDCFGGGGRDGLSGAFKTSLTRTV